MDDKLRVGITIFNPVTKETAGPEYFAKTFDDKSTTYAMEGDDSCVNIAVDDDKTVP